MCVKAKCRYCGCKVLSPMLGFLVLLFHTWYLYVFIEYITQQWSIIIQGQALSMHVVLLKTWFQTNEQHRTAFLVVVGSCHRVGHSIHTLSSIQNPKSHGFGDNLRHSGITFCDVPTWDASTVGNSFPTNLSSHHFLFLGYWNPVSLEGISAMDMTAAVSHPGKV